MSNNIYLDLYSFIGSAKS